MIRIGSITHGNRITIRRNGSPLYGTTLSKQLKLHLLENKVKDLYIALDSDALAKAIDAAEYLMAHGMNVYFVEIPKGQDPNSLGFTKMWELIDNTPKLQPHDLFKYKVSISV